MYPATEDSFGGRGEGCGGGRAHAFQDLEQSPALTFVSLGGTGAFSFEVDVVDEAERAFGCLEEAGEVGLDAIGIARLTEHFWESSLKAADDELGLEGDRLGEELAELGLPRTGFVGFKLRFRRPWAGAKSPIGHGRAAAAKEGGEGRKAFFKGTSFSGGIPDEMADAERGEVLSAVPAGQSGDGASALILPDPLADALELVR